MAEQKKKDTSNNLPPEDIRPATRALPNVPTMSNHVAISEE
jgi:hypothetical protein